jgi:hypothetical protein
MKLVLNARFETVDRGRNFATGIFVWKLPFGKASPTDFPPLDHIDRLLPARKLLAFKNQALARASRLFAGGDD